MPKRTAKKARARKPAAAAAPSVDISKMIPLPEAARLADVDETWLRKLVASGKVAGLKIGRNYIVDADSAKAFQRDPSRGRPRAEG